MWEEFESEEQDEEVLSELKERRKAKSFTEVINKKKLSKYELEEAMV